MVHHKGRNAWGNFHKRNQEGNEIWLQNLKDIIFIIRWIFPCLAYVGIVFLLCPRFRTTDEVKDSSGARAWMVDGQRITISQSNPRNLQVHHQNAIEIRLCGFDWLHWLFLKCWTLFGIVGVERILFS